MSCGVKHTQRTPVRVDSIGKTCILLDLFEGDFLGETHPLLKIRVVNLEVFAAQKLHCFLKLELNSHREDRQTSLVDMVWISMGSSKDDVGKAEGLLQAGLPKCREACSRTLEVHIQLAFGFAALRTKILYNFHMSSNNRSNETVFTVDVGNSWVSFVVLN